MKTIKKGDSKTGIMQSDFKEGSGFYKVEALDCIDLVYFNESNQVFLYLGPWDSVPSEILDIISPEPEIEIEKPQQPDGFVSENFAFKMAALIKSRPFDLKDLDI